MPLEKEVIKLEISRRRFLQVGGLSALAAGMFSHLTANSLFTREGVSPEKIDDSYQQPLWNLGSPYLACSTSYFNKLNPTTEERWLDMLHFHMSSNCRDRFLFQL